MNLRFEIALGHKIKEDLKS